MRDVNRIDKTCEAFAEQWKRVSDWRLGQVIMNFLSAYGDPFYWEEDEFIKRLTEYMDMVAPKE